MGFEGFRWFGRRNKEDEENRRQVLDEIQGLRKLLRKQSALIEEMRRELVEGPKGGESLIELCDSIFYLCRAFRDPGLMSRQHAQVLDMTMIKARLFAASFGIEMIVEEGTPFDPEIHEAIANRNPGSDVPEVFEVVQPGYLQNGAVLRPAKVVVGAASPLTSPAQESEFS